MVGVARTDGVEAGGEDLDGEWKTPGEEARFGALKSF